MLSVVSRWGSNIIRGVCYFIMVLSTFIFVNHIAIFIYFIVIIICIFIVVNIIIDIA